MEDVQDLLRDIQEDSRFGSYMHYGHDQREPRRQLRPVEYGSQSGYFDATQCLEPSVYSRRSQSPPYFGEDEIRDDRDAPLDIYGSYTHIDLFF